MDKIKYHDNNVLPMYGEDHMLTDNWNPDAQYNKDEYVEVHFRIETPSYMRGEKMFQFEDEEKEAFVNETADIFKKLGWNIDKMPNNGSCMQVSKGKSHLYLHPQDFSGDILKTEVKEIATALKENKTFYLGWVDLYKTVYDMADEAYVEYLSGKEDLIREMLYNKCKTVRCTLYHEAAAVIDAVGMNIRIPRIGLRNSVCDKTTAEYVGSVLTKMAEEGYLYTKFDECLVRSANKTELRKSKLEVPAA